MAATVVYLHEPGEEAVSQQDERPSGGERGYFPPHEVELVLFVRQGVDFGAEGRRGDGVVGETREELLQLHAEGLGLAVGNCG